MAFYGGLCGLFLPPAIIILSMVSFSFFQTASLSFRKETQQRSGTQLFLRPAVGRVTAAGAKKVSKDASVYTVDVRSFQAPKCAYILSEFLQECRHAEAEELIDLYSCRPQPA